MWLRYCNSILRFCNYILCQDIYSRDFLIEKSNHLQLIKQTQRYAMCVTLIAYIVWRIVRFQDTNEMSLKLIKQIDQRLARYEDSDHIKQKFSIYLMSLIKQYKRKKRSLNYSRNRLKSAQDTEKWVDDLIVLKYIWEDVLRWFSIDKFFKQLYLGIGNFYCFLEFEI